MTANTLNQISRREYGYDVTIISATAAVWLADLILQETGKNVYRRIASLRRKCGQYTAFPSYGSALFNTL